jgi:hypothetical protein
VGRLPVRPCEKCGFRSAVAGNRYCGPCRKLVIKELREAGYITPIRYTMGRAAEAKENRRETKYGVD